MQGILNMINAWTLAFYLGAKQRISNEVNHLKEDESGMEIVQVVIILLIVVVIVAALWGFLRPWVQEMIDNMRNTQSSTDPFEIN